MRKLAIPFLISTESGFIARVIDSDGGVEQARWVGPFRNAESIVEWLDYMQREHLGIVLPPDIGLPMELCVLRPLAEQVAKCKQCLAEKKEDEHAQVTRNDAVAIMDGESGT